jgi:hypothetical protein
MTSARIERGITTEGIEHAIDWMARLDHGFAAVRCATVMACAE